MGIIWKGTINSRSVKLLKYQSFHSANWTQAQIRGDYGTHVEVNNSGKNIVLTYIDPDNAIGYVMAGGSIRTSKYVCEEEEWAVFEKYD